MKNTLVLITRTAIIASLYLVLSIVVAPLSFGPIQFRISEIMVLLPAFIPAAIPGLTIGCFLANFFFSSIYDAIIGTIATLFASIFTFILRKNLILASIPPIIINSLLIPLIWLLDGTTELYFINFGTILASELIICGIVGIPFTKIIRHTLYNAHIIKPISNKYSSQEYVYDDSEDDDN